jgi:hypothetical protein
MVNIKNIKKSFNIHENCLNLSINYNEDKLSIIFNIENKIIKKTKASIVIYGNCNVNNEIFYFKSLINFIIINNQENIFLSNISINQLCITDINYNIIPDIPDDDYVETLLYDLLKNLFLSCKFIKVKDSDINRYQIDFNIQINNIINEYNISIIQLSSYIKFGIFSENFFII